MADSGFTPGIPTPGFGTAVPPRSDPSEGNPPPIPAGGVGNERLGTAPPGSPAGSPPDKPLTLLNASPNPDKPASSPGPADVDGVGGAWSMGPPPEEPPASDPGSAIGGGGKPTAAVDGISGKPSLPASATRCDPDAEGELRGTTVTLPGTPAAPILDKPSARAVNPESAPGAGDASDTPEIPTGALRSGEAPCPTASDVGIAPIDRVTSGTDAADDPPGLQPESRIWPAALPSAPTTPTTPPTAAAKPPAAVDAAVMASANGSIPPPPPLPGTSPRAEPACRSAPMFGERSRLSSLSRDRMSDNTLRVSARRPTSPMLPSSRSISRAHRRPAARASASSAANDCRNSSARRATSWRAPSSVGPTGVSGITPPRRYVVGSRSLSCRQAHGQRTGIRHRAAAWAVGGTLAVQAV